MLSLRYYFQKYGEEKIGPTGCGPFSCAIVASTLLEKEICPVSVAKWSVEYGFYEYQHGSYHSLIPKYLTYLGLKCEDLGNSVEKLENLLEQKNSMGIILCRKGVFSKGNHFVAVGKKGNYFKVYNSSNVFDCYKKYDKHYLENALLSERIYIGPIWYISREEI